MRGDDEIGAPHPPLAVTTLLTIPKAEYSDGLTMLASLSLLSLCSLIVSEAFLHPAYQPRRASLQMLTIEQEETSIGTPSGPMRTAILRPNAPGRYPGIVFYSEIFQLTGPIMRSASVIAGHGFVVAVPEIYHSSSPGWVGGYTTEGADEGNRLKVTTSVETYDGDSAAAIEYLKNYPHCTGKIGTAGFCVGGHLSLRAALVNDGVHAVASWYATDIHTGDGVCGGLSDRSKDTMNLFHRLPLNNNGDGTEVLMIFGKQDRHVDGNGRLKLYQALTDAGAHFEWLEFNGMHAFMRDEGYRYDPMLEMITFQHAIALFNRKLHEGDLKAAAPMEKGALNAKM